MLSFDDAAAIAAAPTTASIDPSLRQLIADRVDDLTTTELLDLTHLVIVQPGDTEQSIREQVAFSPLVNVIDGERFGSKNFVPSWDWLEAHDGYWELILTVADSGFAFILMIENRDGLDPDLRRLLETYAPATHQ